MAYVKPKYTFTTTFINNLKTRIGVDFTEDIEAYIRMMMDNTKPHKKVDNKNRHSEYFTFFIYPVNKNCISTRLLPQYLIILYFLC